MELHHANQSLVVVDPKGMQVADLFCFAADNLRDGLSSGRSIDYNETIAFGVGHQLYAQSGRAMLRVLPPRSEPGARVRFIAQMDLVVGLTACSDEGSNGGVCKPIEYEIER